MPLGGVQENDVKRKRMKKERKQHILRKPSVEEVSERESDAMLSEFSDDYNDFYVDEVSEKEEQLEEERREEAIEKTAKVARKKPISPMRRKLMRILSYVTIITVVIVVGVILSLTVLFKTRSYEVIGNTLYNDSDVITMCDIPEGTNIFMAPKEPAAKRIKDSFPYFEDVKVGFKIPDTIKIEVTQAVEGYLVKISDKEYLLISTKGRILNRVTDKSKYDLPIFIGPKLASGDIGDYVEYEDETIVNIIENITQVFADNGYQGITEVDATNTANVTFTYAGRIKVKLGIPEDVSYKVRTAMTIISTKIDVVEGSSIRGTLDVSRCNTTKRSYFDEDKSIDVNATEDPSAPTQAAVDGGVDGGYVDGGYDTGVDQGNYDWQQDQGYVEGGYDNGGYDNGGYDNSYDDGSYNNGGYDNGGYDTGYDGSYDNGGYDGGYDNGGYYNNGDIPGNNPASPY